MKNTFGTNVKVTIFGESHGEMIGAVLDGLSPKVTLDMDFIALQMQRRKGANSVSTARREDDLPNFVSGVFENKTTGTPICALIKNSAQHSKDYSKTRFFARPGHADYTAFLKYHGCEDFRGGGHFSGRITAPLVAVGSICQMALKKRGITIVTHIKSLGGILDRDIKSPDDENVIKNADLPVLDCDVRKRMKEEISKVRADGDSIGGVLGTSIFGVNGGVGEPFFDSVESLISHAMFSIPGVKGIEFGEGFGFCSEKGSFANDEFFVKDGKIMTKTNHNGGINGGITNGMPITFNLAVKPTPSIFKDQNTVDFEKNENVTLKISGRHDPAIIHRASVVVEALTAITLCDILEGTFGVDYFGD